MRLTEKETNIVGVETGFYRLKKDYSNSFILDNCGNQRELNSLFLGQQKLGLLENNEEELDIDLIVFGKVLQALDRECVYVKIKETKQYDDYSLDEETGEIRRCVIVRFSRYSNGLRDWFFTISFDISSVNHYLLKDYGKTWALTREELL